MGTNSMKTLQALAKAIVQAVKASRVDSGRLDLSESDEALERQYIQAMIEAFESGALTVHRESSLLPMRPSAPGALAGALIVGVVSIQEVNRWLPAIGIPLQVSEAQFSDNVNHEKQHAIAPSKRLTLKSEVVKDAAKGFANQIASERVNSGSKMRISARSVCEQVAELLLEDPAIRFKCCADSVRRHLLVRWTPQITLQDAGANGATGAWDKKVS